MVMFKWIRSRRPRSEADIAPAEDDVERDSGDEEYAAHTEDEHEISPSGLTRVKTDEI
jgi:hypothetical protein